MKLLLAQRRANTQRDGVAWVPNPRPMTPPFKNPGSAPDWHAAVMLSFSALVILGMRKCIACTGYLHFHMSASCSSRKQSTFQSTAVDNNTVLLRAHLSTSWHPSKFLIENTFRFLCTENDLFTGLSVENLTIEPHRISI